MPEGRSHELSVVVVQTLGAVLVAGITGVVTYLNTSYPLKEKIERLEQGIPTPPTVTAVQDDSKLKTAQAEIASLKSQLVKEGIQKSLNEAAWAVERLKLEEANKLLYDISVSMDYTTVSETFKFSDCKRIAKAAQNKFATGGKNEDELLVSFKVGRNQAVIYCASEGKRYSVVVAGVDSNETLSALKREVRKSFSP
jgi:hypothetical protein